ncbi:MAG: heme-binding protein [Alphaproteobacteria bacterium]|nr:heme-binding protein [Alphaproteobacteria bacterium]
MTPLTLEQASTIVDTALAKGREAKLMPLTVVVLDTGGHLLAMKREDGCGILRYEIARGKAYGALGMGISTRMIFDFMSERVGFLNALSGVADGRFVPVPGGVLIKDGDGKTIGAVGISGDVSDRDEYAAIEGVKATGLTADPDEPAENWESARP